MLGLLTSVPSAPLPAAERVTALGEPVDSVCHRPRERLLRGGVERVDDADLLALVLGTGTRGHSAGQVAARLLAQTGGVGGLTRAGPHELTIVDGIGPAQAARVVAALALGVRAVGHHRDRSDELISAADVHRRLWPRVVGRAQEAFFVVALDARSKIIAEVEVARGHLTGVEVHPREVFRPLVVAAAAAAVCAHNHPSGDPTPSPEDLLLTRRLCEVGDLIGIPIIDHVVIAEHGYASLAAWLRADG